MKKNYSFDYLFDADRGIPARSMGATIEQVERWAEEEEKENVSILDVLRKEKKNNPCWGVPNETRDAYDYEYNN